MPDTAIEISKVFSSNKVVMMEVMKEDTARPNMGELISSLVIRNTGGRSWS